MEDRHILNYENKFVYNDEAKKLVKRVESSMSLKELQLICDRLNIADEVCLETIDLWLAKDAIKSIITGLKKYPMLRSKICYFGTLNGLKKKREKILLKLYGFSFLIINSLRKESSKIIDNCDRLFDEDGIAMAFLLSSNNYQFGGIIINEKDLNQQSIINDLEYGERIGHSPKGCKTIKSVIDHEMGHLLDFDLQVSDSENYKKFIQNYDINTIGKNLSGYCVSNGTINDREVVAEAYSEYCNNPMPRIISAEIGLIMDHKYKERYR